MEAKRFKIKFNCLKVWSYCLRFAVEVTADTVIFFNLNPGLDLVKCLNKKGSPGHVLKKTCMQSARRNCALPLPPYCVIVIMCYY